MFADSLIHVLEYGHYNMHLLVQLRYKAPLVLRSDLYYASRVGSHTMTAVRKLELKGRLGESIHPDGFTCSVPNNSWERDHGRYCT